MVVFCYSFMLLPLLTITCFFHVETVSVITFACVRYIEEMILLSLKKNGVRDYFVVK